MKKPVSQQTACDSPRVSVAMITYNHEKFIAQAIESVLMQVTDFQVEIVIGEDCSTDGTREIVRRYAERHPGAIRALLPEKNQGMHKNAASVLSACRGEYLANLEGDDYWTDPAKLSRQIDLLDADPSMTFCFHRVLCVDETSGKDSRIFPIEDVQSFNDPIKELIHRNYIGTASRLMRRSKMPDFDARFQKLKLGDWPTSILMSLEGKVGFLPETMAVYRFHPGGTWSTQSQLIRDTATYEMFDFLLQFKTRTYKAAIARSSLDFARLVMLQRRSQAMPTSSPCLLGSIKAASKIGFYITMIQATWVLFYVMWPAQDKRWLDALRELELAANDPTPGTIRQIFLNQLKRLVRRFFKTNL